MKRHIAGWLAGCVLLAGHLTGCGMDTSQRMEVFYDSLRAYKVVSLADGKMTYDFDRLQEMNPDVYAWLEIPGTGVSYPVLQSPDDDLMYLTTVCDGSTYAGGSVFTQASYNGTDFTDPVTILYGNTMQDDTMFGSLQELYSGEGPTENRKICVYLREDAREYMVFAAVPYDDTHILYTYDFSEKYWYTNFFRQIRKIRSIGAWYDEACAPEYGDSVIILSTSMKDGSPGRYLVMAKLWEDSCETDGNPS